MTPLHGARSRVLTRLLSFALTALTLVSASLAGAGAASAHAALISTDPAENTTLTESPQRVSATFNEPMQQAFAAMTVVGPDGNLWSTDDPQVEGTVVSVGVRPLGPAGTYTVNYRATSADGHVVSGSWSFDLTVAGPGTPGPTVAPAPAPAASEDDGLPVWPFVLAAVVIVGGGAWWALRRRA
ncbi:copper resistance CopC family protein [Mycolicibacterium smegmatis]|jgi:methionine-rich copper-binding protein CopC|uniref:copper resistance CopC family protein n=1 Tax=Mycolicibacterium smegmatis TaxID=1772 RepID=UPI0005D7B83E|nr:copper resistance CopC family protein [Mycolicibacterium smegmatis]MCP2621767.1 copper resistance protein CopC [Mycolicibacterium smegmatis]MDF1901562.1 copper resistance protein CopC [Mycolicibacterium smegmatis]MDF1907825.1 copper resistance protein CopC [Mycolicibacterium smegmatis]MDF1918005.1 copper resistance protein CopC [Mycolicibacterium smegmatis]MDF1926085.1 copper resistance protein CopC [Mycolicibacterium smegmatis]